MKYFEDYQKGEKFTYKATYKITEEELLEFGRRWDNLPIHTDKAAAEKSMFGSLIASSSHLYAIAVSLSNKANAELCPAVISGLGVNKMDFLKPARVGDILRMTGTTLECRLSNSRKNAGLIVNRNELINQNNEVVLLLEGTFLVRCRATEVASAI